jgi:hypothetical protein
MRSRFPTMPESGATATIPVREVAPQFRVLNSRKKRPYAIGAPTRTPMKRAESTSPWHLHQGFNHDHDVALRINDLGRHSRTPNLLPTVRRSCPMGPAGPFTQLAISWLPGECLMIGTALMLLFGQSLYEI